MRKVLVIAAALICFGQSQIVNLTSKKTTEPNLKQSQPPKANNTPQNKNLSTRRVSSTQNFHPSLQYSLDQQADTTETEFNSQNVSEQIISNNPALLVASNQSKSPINKKQTQNHSYYHTSPTQSASLKNNQSSANSKTPNSPFSNRDQQHLKKQQTTNIYPVATSTFSHSSNTQPSTSKSQSASQNQTLGKSASSSPQANTTKARPIQKSSSRSLNIPVNTRPVSNYQKSSSSNAQKSKNSYVSPTYNKNNFKGKGNIIDGQKNSGSGAGNVILGKSNQVNGNLNKLSGNSNSVYGQQNLIKASSNIVVGQGNVIN